jgi:hypothetical protein
VRRRASIASVTGLEGRHVGQTASIVGRGPSLLQLTASDLIGPVLTLNHAILEIRKLRLSNPLYSLQKDGCIVEPQLPETVILSRGQSPTCWRGYPRRVVIDVRSLGLQRNCMSSTLAVALAHRMGCSGVRMMAMDSFTRDDFRTVVGGELNTIGRGYLHAANQASAHAARLGLLLEWVA